MALMEKVRQHVRDGMPNADVLLRDQFVQHVLDGVLHQELKQLVCRQPTATLLTLHSEAIRWKREGVPGSEVFPCHLSMVYNTRCRVSSLCHSPEI